VLVDVTFCLILVNFVTFESCQLMFCKVKVLEQFWQNAFAKRCIIIIIIIYVVVICSYCVWCFDKLNILFLVQSGTTRMHLLMSENHFVTV